jgi:hypothetical protein
LFSNGTFFNRTAFIEYIKQEFSNSLDLIYSL